MSAESFNKSGILKNPKSMQKKIYLFDKNNFTH